MSSKPVVDVRKVLADAEQQSSLRAMNGENDLTSVALREAFGAVEQLFTDVRAALEMLERDGKADSPLAGFLRAALARAGGAA